MELDTARLSERSSLFYCETLDGAELSVISFEAREQVNQLSSTEVSVLAWGAAAATSDDQLLGRHAALVVNVPDGAPRTFHGVVVMSRTEHVREDGRVERRLHIAPRLWLLTKRKHSRIFQDKSIREIVDVVLDEIGAPRAWRVAARFAPRPYCVQYDETDHDFVARILAEEGVFYFFEEPVDPESGILRDGEVVVFADTAASYEPLRGGPQLTFRQGAHRGDLAVPESTVGELALSSAVEPTAVRVSDYDFRRPLLDLTITRAL